MEARHGSAKYTKPKSCPSQDWSALLQTRKPKSKGYQRCNALWLLVVADFFDRAQDQQLQQLSDRETPKTDVFEEIILYQTVSRIHCRISRSGRTGAAAMAITTPTGTHHGVAVVL
jgi:hypothetical protein